MRNPQSGSTPDWRFLVIILSRLPHKPNWQKRQISRDRSSDYSFKVNQVESAFIPLRSMLFPSHTANAMGTDIPALN